MVQIRDILPVARRPVGFPFWLYELKQWVRRCWRWRRRFRWKCRTATDSDEINKCPRHKHTHTHPPARSFVRSFAWTCIHLIWKWNVRNYTVIIPNLQYYPQLFLCIICKWNGMGQFSDRKNRHQNTYIQSHAHNLHISPKNSKILTSHSQESFHEEMHYIW